MDNWKKKLVAEIPETEGWTSMKEIEILHDISYKKQVLELGCWKGKSTVALLMNAEHVTVVDVFDNVELIPEEKARQHYAKELKERIPEGQTLKEIFKHYTRWFNNIAVFEANVDQFFKMYNTATYDVVFVDDDHTYQSVIRDFNHIKKHIHPNSIIAFHDYNEAWLDVNRALIDLQRKGWIQMLNREGSLGLFKPTTKTLKEKEHEITPEELQ